MSSDLRVWQQQALTKYLDTKPHDFLAVATPGAGKTTFALKVATELKTRRTVDRIIVVVPTEHLKVQWSEAAARVGLSLDPAFKNTDAINPQYDGVVVTYAQVAMRKAGVMASGRPTRMRRAAWRSRVRHFGRTIPPFHLCGMPRMVRGI